MQAGAGDVMLGDALYCHYFLIATMVAAGVDVLFERNRARTTDFNRGTSLGTRDHLVCRSKPVRPPRMTPEQYAVFPDQLKVLDYAAFALHDHTGKTSQT